MPSLQRFRAYARRAAMSWCALLLCASTLPAQPLAGAFVRVGDRVRVTTYEMASSGERHVGVLQRVLRDSVTVDWAGGARETLPLHRVSRLEVSDGRGNMVRPGMGYGLLAGAIIGVTRGTVKADDGGEYFPPAAVVTVSTLAGALAGTVAGGLLGAIGRRERWTRVRLEQPLRRVTVTPHVLPTGRGTSRAGVHVIARF